MKWQAMEYCEHFILILSDEGLGYRKNLYKAVIKKKQPNNKGSKDFNRPLTKQDIRLANRCMKMFSMSLVVLGKCRLKLQQEITSYPLQQLGFKSLIIPSAGKGVEQLEGSYIVDRSVKWFDHFTSLFSSFS